MKHTTVCYLIKHSPELEVLLGLKKVGFGRGKYAGIGGKVEAGESIAEAAIREVEEEIGVKIPINSIQHMGIVSFLFPSKVEWNQEVSIFTTHNWQGEPIESEEMKPFWFKFADIPYQSMWQDNRFWLPQILDGNKLNLTISFKNDNETVDEVF